MRARDSTLLAGLAAGFFLALPPAAEADLIGGGTFLAGVPQGDFDKAVGTGYGLEGHVLIAPRQQPFGLRVQGAFLVYGSETFTVPFAGTGGRVGYDVTTDNWIGSFALGPEFMARSGTVRPYLHALVGLSYFATTSDVHSEDAAFPFASSTNYDDTTFRWSVGGGVAIPVGRSLAIDLGVGYESNSSVNYLVEGDIHDDGHGGIFFTPRRSEADLVRFTIGFVAGF